MTGSLGSRNLPSSRHTACLSLENSSKAECMIIDILSQFSMDMLVDRTGKRSPNAWATRQGRKSPRKSLSQSYRYQQNGELEHKYEQSQL